MKKTELLNAPIVGAIARMGHTDGLAVCDAGLPIPGSTDRIDLALRAGVPGFLETCAAILTELYPERIVIAEELAAANPELVTALVCLVQDASPFSGRVCAVETVPHAEFKTRVGDCVACVRTGEIRPYANVIFHSGVLF